MSLKKNGVAEIGKFSECGLLEEMETKYFENAVWAKVFDHNVNGGNTVFNSIDEVKNCNTTNKYSRLYLLDSFKTKDGKIEFLLEYPDDVPNKYNRWKQTNNPFNEYMGSGTRPVTGYEAVHIDWSGSYWGGLERHLEDPTSFNEAYLDGSVGHTNWYFAIGLKSKYGTGSPGPSGMSSIAGRIWLWVRIDTLPDENICRLTKNNCLVASDFYEI